MRKEQDDQFAEEYEELDYQPYRQTYALPKWKDTKGKHEKCPPRDYGTERHTDKEIYYSRDVMEQEWERLWTKVWLLAGHLSDIPKQNSFMKVNRGHESVLVVRGKGDTVHAMYNVCQHRGARLELKDFGTVKKFRCPFHSWEYSPTGRLTKLSDRETFKKDAICHDLNLPQVKSAVWRGWVFISFADDPIPIEDYLGAEWIERTAAYDFEKVMRIRDVEQEWPANWKVAHEAFIEGYHVQATHPQLQPAVDAYHSQHDLFDNGQALSVYQFMSPMPHVIDAMPDTIVEEHKIFLREAGVPEKKFPKHWKDVPKAIIQAKKTRKNYVIDYSKFTEGQLIDDWSFGIFPTTEAFMHPEGFFIQAWDPHPTDPDKCIYRVKVYAVPGIGELPSFMGVDEADFSGKRVLPRRYIETDDMENLGPVICQDRAVVPRVQMSVRSKGFKGNVLGEQEIRIRHFYNEYYKYMRGHKS